MYRKKK